MALGRFFGDRLRSRLSAARLVRLSASLAAAGLIVALLAPWAAMAVAGFAIVGLGLSNLVPIFFSAAARIPGQPSGTGIAAVATLGYGGFLIGPPVIGAVAEATSLTLALGSTVLASLAIALAATAVAPRRRQSGSGQT
jgi:fucose permease